MTTDAPISSDDRVTDYTGEQMMERWFQRYAKSTSSNRGRYLWAVVSEVFGVGSTVAMAQCEKYGKSAHMRVRSRCL